MKSLYIFLLLAFASLTVKAQNTYVPDDNFEQALIDLGYDSGALDDYVPTDNINTVSTLGLVNKGISDLTGIEAFIALRELYCNFNNLSSIDITNNTALEHLDVGNNSLTNLNTSNNLALTVLEASFNNLISLDVSNNTSLVRLSFAFNNLITIDISNNIVLTHLVSNTNSINSLDLNNNEALEIIDISYNNLSSLDLENNTALTSLSCHINNLTHLDVSNNSALEYLSCSYNNIDRLNLKNNTSLEQLYCINNELIGINLKNGANTKIIYFNALSNPDLECIQVDDPAYSEANWTNIDPTSSFRRNCRYVATYGNRLQQELFDSENESFTDEKLSIYPNPVNNEFSISLQSDVNYSIHNINGQQLLDGKLKKGEHRLNVSKLQAGMYVLNIIKDGISVHKKFIKN